MSIEATVYGSGAGDPVGFIGLGHMGGPMAGRLMDAGYPLVVHDAAPAAAKLSAHARREVGAHAGCARRAGAHHHHHLTVVAGGTGPSSAGLTDSWRGCGRGACSSR